MRRKADRTAIVAVPKTAVVGVVPAWGFESLAFLQVSVVQLVGRPVATREVAGSIPARDSGRRGREGRYPVANRRSSERVRVFNPCRLRKCRAGCSSTVERRTVAPEMAVRSCSARPWVRISNWTESRIPIPDVAGSSPAAPAHDGVAQLAERVPLKRGAVCVNMEAWKTETRTTGTTWRSDAGVGGNSRSRCWAGSVLSAGAPLGWRWTTSIRGRSRSDSLDVICPRHVSWRNWRSASSSAMRATTRRRSWSAGRSQLRGRTGRCRPIDTAIARSVGEQSVSGRGCIDRGKRSRRRSATGARSAVNRRVGSSNLSVAANVPVSQLWKRNLSQKEEKAWVRPPPGTPCAGSRMVHAAGSGPAPVERSLGVRVSPRVPHGTVAQLVERRT